jgi:hypothetical protein
MKRLGLSVIPDKHPHFEQFLCRPLTLNKSHGTHGTQFALQETGGLANKRGGSANNPEREEKSHDR